MAASSKAAEGHGSDGDRVDIGASSISAANSPEHLFSGSYAAQIEDEVDSAEPPRVLEAKPKHASKQNVRIVDTDAAEANGSSSSVVHQVFDAKTLAVEKLRCMDKQQFKYPWERGSLKRIFGQVDPIPNKRLTLQPSDYNPFKVAVQVGNNAKVTAAIDYEVDVPSGAIFLKVVRSMEQLDYKWLVETPFY